MTISPSDIPPDDLARSIESAWAEYIQAEEGRSQYAERPYVYASAWRPCLRRMVLEMTDGDKLPPFNAETLAKFHRGNDRERDLLVDFKRVGRVAEPNFEVIGEQERFELRDRKGRVAIVGKIDAKIKFPWGVAPVEVKAWSPWIIDKIRSFEDLFEGIWTRSGAYQLLAYLLGMNVPLGFLLLDRSGLPLLLPVELYPNLGRIENFLIAAEQAMDHKEAGTLPDYIQDAEECQRCPFYGSVCNPPLKHDAMTVLSDPELEAILERREQLKAAALEYDHLDADVKKKLRGVEQGVAGRFLIEGKWGRSTSYDIPPELKKQYEKVDPQGRFTLKITAI